MCGLFLYFPSELENLKTKMVIISGLSNNWVLADGGFVRHEKAL
jgi:hypothetical protein